MQLIDVGTGLAILIQGSDFTMLYDGGSGDDRAGITTVGSTIKNGNRLLAYLFAALGPSGEAACAPDGDAWTQTDRPELTIDHLVLSHPHEDHDSLLDDVIRCYHVKEVWDAGDNNNREGYAKFLGRAAVEPGVIYHTAGNHHAGEVLTVFGHQIMLPRSTRPVAENDVVSLGSGATMTVLHVDGHVFQDENLNSMVLRVDLGRTGLLLMGDAESGARTAASAALGHTEADLVARQSSKLKADILQVAHHGSSTSSRLGILQLIQPRVALIGAGPLPYSGAVLPDQSVIDALGSLTSKPLILRTDKSDATVGSCAKNGVKVNRIGLDDQHPGGCDNFSLSM